MRTSKAVDLTRGSVTKQMILFMIPILLTNLLQQLYTVADRVVVGQFAENGKMALAAVGSTSSATTLFLNLFTGFAVGANVICANLCGAKDRKGSKLCMHSAMLLSVVIGFGVGLLSFVLCEPLLRLLDTPEDVLDMAALYMRIYALGIPASSIYNFGASILRAHGDTKRPMYILAATGVVNVVLNLVLVIILHMSADGVAIATVVSQYISAVWVVLILFSKTGAFKMEYRSLRFHKGSMASVVRVGVPCGLNGMVFTLSNLILQASLNTFGSIAIAGKTAALDISTLLYQIIVSVYTACVSFAGQCYGARQYKRIDALLLRSIGVCCGGILAAAVLCTVFSRQLLGLFNSDPAVIDAGMDLLMINCWGYLIYSISETTLGCLRGMGQSGVPSLLNFCGICLPRILWVLLIFPMHRTIMFLYLCYPISYAVSAVLQLGCYIHCRKKLNAQI